MKLTFLTYGSLGDIQPFVTLALGLQKAGHRVRLAAPENFRDFVTGFGLDYAPIVGDTQALLDSMDGKDWLSRTNLRKSLKGLKKISALTRDEFNRNTLEACQGADAILATVLTVKHGICLSDKLRVPLLLGMIYPILPRSRDFANVFISSKKLPLPFLNTLSHRLVEMALWKDLKPDMSAWCDELGLPRPKRNIYDEITHRKIPILHLYSEQVFTKPSDWGPENILTGAMPPNSSKAPASTEFARWLEQGKPPVFIGFGSMPMPDPKAVFDMVIDVSRELGLRAVIGAGWSKLKEGPLSESVFALGRADYSWLFPRCSAVVHHGGAGTTMTAVASGVPSAICSFIVDQPFWGQQLEKRGLGVTIPFRKLNRAHLKDILLRLQSPEIRENCKRAAQRMNAETGLGNAVREIETRLGVRQSSASA